MIDHENEKILKTSLLSAAIIGVAVLLLQGFLIPQPMNRAFGIEQAQVDKIDLFDGMYGTHRIITGKNEITKFLDRFSGAYVRKDFDQRQMNGVIFSAALYRQGKEMSSFTFGYDRMLYRDTRYCSNFNIDADKIAEIEKTYGLKRQQSTD